MIAREYQEASVEGLTPDQVAALRDGLRRVVENLTRFDAGAAPPSDDSAEPS